MGIGTAQRSHAPARRASEAYRRRRSARGGSQSDVVLSVCPPHAALDVARAVAAERFHWIYVDANAVSRATAEEIGKIVTKPARASSTAASSARRSNKRAPRGSIFREHAPRSRRAVLRQHARCARDRRRTRRRFGVESRLCRLDQRHRRFDSRRSAPTRPMKASTRHCSKSGRFPSRRWKRNAIARQRRSPCPRCGVTWARCGDRRGFRSRGPAESAFTRRPLKICERFAFFEVQNLQGHR